MSRVVRFAPLILLILLVAALVWRLSNPEDTTVKSRLVGKPVPDLLLGAMTPEGQRIPLKPITGRPTVVNFFASWCVPCIAEAPVLAEMKRRGVPIIGIAVRDRPDDINEFLSRHGNPYTIIGTDPESRIQLAVGSSGVPESFVIDGQGVLRYQHIGEIEVGDLPVILSELEKAR